jgi:3-keto-disaccharide hydrolase
MAAQAQEPPNWVPHLISAEEAAEGFYPLFNGKDRDGWHQTGSNKDAFAIENGELLTTGEGGGGWLETDRAYANFVLRLEYRLGEDEDCNSGVGIRVPKGAHPSSQGFEVQIIVPGWKVDWQAAGALYSAIPPEVRASNPQGEWNTMEILCDGPRIRATLNGQVLYDIQTTDYPEPLKEGQSALADRPYEGHIKLQDYGRHVWFREIRIRPLPGGPGWKPLFNGKDLSGWQVDGDPVWHIFEDGVLRVDGSKGWDRGRNALRTVAEYGDFDLQLSFRPHNAANSGVFFRCSGDDPWPRTYESQIHNHNPEQFTGAIWNQQPATKLRAEDGRWNHMHISAKGPEITVAVNGKVVNEYTSPKHDQYPRGWITLQGHDPESIVDFKDIEIKVAE